MTTATDRYASLFDALAARHEGAFVPFFVLGDPDLDTSARLLRAAVQSGADALEVGIPFSDPIADGPTLQRASLRAQASGATVRACFDLLAAFRADHPTVPVGILTYANLVVHAGADAFYARAAAAGADSVLVADVPLLEAEPFAKTARAHGISPILLAPPNLPRDRIARIAEISAGYTYVVARKGVTGVRDTDRSTDVRDTDRSSSAATNIFQALRAANAPPPLLGFGIATPAHVRDALAAGAAGAICGSAIARLIEDHPERSAAVTAVADLVRRLKDATLGESPIVV